MSVQSEITRLANAKTAIATAIEGKGVTVPEGTKLDGMATLVEAIEAGGGSDIVVGTFTTAEDTDLITLPGVEYNATHFLAIFYDRESGTVTSGHFRIGMDVQFTRVSRYYSSTMNEYSPQLQRIENSIKIFNAKFQAGITYRYIFAKELW